MRSPSHEQRAKRMQLQTQLEETRLVAPLSGTVALRFVNRGAVVDAGQPILRLIRADDVRVRFAVPEGTLPEVRPGESVRILVGAPAHEVRGVVRHVAPEIDTASRTIFAEAELALDSKDAQLPKRGVTCRVFPLR